MSRFLLRLVISLGLLFTASVAAQPSASPPPNVIALQAPGFLRVAHAQEEPAGVGIAAVQDEAGIAAYFDRGASINLAQVRGLFRTIEVDNGSYILGSMQATGTNSYAESEDPHVYVNANGWVMAYYLNTDPAAKIINVWNYSGTTIDTKLEMALRRVGTAIGIGSGFTAAYYDFRYPNANRLMLIAEAQSDRNNGDSFQVSLPGTFTYYERSWTLGDSLECCTSVRVRLNGTQLLDYISGRVVSGSLSPAQLPIDLTSTFLVEGGDNGLTSVAGVAIVYRDVP